MEQKIGPLSPEMAAHAERQRTWVREHYTEDARHNYDTVEGKLRLLETILSAGWINPDETWKLQSLGITFGDALEQELGLVLISVEDELGCDPALQLSGTSTIVFPLTTISKRVERGDVVNVRDLFTKFCRTVQEKREEGW